MKSLRVYAAFFALLLLPVSASFAQFDRAAARESIAANSDAVITVEIVLSIKAAGYGGQMDTEQKTETIGFIIGADGLAVTSLSAVDPGSFYSAFSGEEDAYVTRVKAMKYIMPDNEEIEAAVVLRDPDLDLCFLKPVEKPARELAYISLEGDGKAGLMDEIIAVTRLGRIGRRAIAAMTGEVQSVIDKPRIRYVTDGEITSARQGAPVFKANGELLGMNSMYLFPGGRKSLGESDEPVMFVVLPVSSIRPVAEQAKTMEPEKPEAEAAEEPQESATEEITPPVLDPDSTPMHDEAPGMDNESGPPSLN